MIEQLPARISHERSSLHAKPFVLTQDFLTTERAMLGNGVADFENIRKGNLLDKVSTDYIIPSIWCMKYSDPENLGKYLLTGIGGINVGDIQNSGANTLIVGDSFGRGSSREHAQLALKGAGIKFILAESTERIFRENCRNYGIFTLPISSGISQKIIQGEVVEFDEILSHYDKLTQDIYRAGGLLSYTKARLENYVRFPLVDTPRRPMTIAEKIIAKNTRVNGIGDDGVTAVKPGDVLLARVDKKYAYELQTIISQKVLNDTFGESAPVNNTNTWLFEDHLALMPHDVPVTVRHRNAQRAFAEKYNIAEYRADGDGVEGICHTVMLEKHVLPGELVLGNDSHTCHLGVANALAIGKGASEFAAALITGDIPVKVPETIRIVLKGKFKEGLSTTDAMLSLISRQDFKEGIASERVLQFAGDALNEISIDSQATFTNMSIEGQAFTGVVEPNKSLLDYVVKRHGLSEDQVADMFIFPDKDAIYFDEIELDLEKVERMVSLPGDTQKAIPLSEVKGTKVDFFYVGSCKGATLEALREVAAIMQDRHVADGVIFQLQAGSREIEEAAKAEGVWDVLRHAGVEIIGRGCGPCMGATVDASERKEIVLSDTDRNFEGRMGKNRKAYLVGPAVVAASATAGYICAPEDLPSITFPVVA